MIKTQVARTLPLAGAMPGRIESMEYASNELWAALRALPLVELKALRMRSHPAHVPLFEALVSVRALMGD